MAQVNAAYDLLRAGGESPAPSARRTGGPRGRGAWLAPPCAGRWAPSCWRRSSTARRCAYVTPTATWSSARAVLVVTDRRLLWLLDDVVTARVQWLRFTRDRARSARSCAGRGGASRCCAWRPTTGGGFAFAELRPPTAEAIVRRVGGRGGVSTDRLDRRGLAVLATGHLWADFLQGSIPALLPVPDRRARLLLRGGGRAGARLERRLVAHPAAVRGRVGPARAAVADAGGAVRGRRGAGGGGLDGRYPATVAAVAVSGLGVAAFHPEGARYANYVSRGQRGRGMSMFSLGGNAGFALGPLLMTPAVLAFGLHGTALALIPLWLGAGLLVAELRPPADVRAGGRARGRATATAAAVPTHGARSRGSASVVGLRSVVFFGLQAFVPVYFAHRAGDERGGRQRRAVGDAGGGRGAGPTSAGG